MSRQQPFVACLILVKNALIHFITDVHYTWHIGYTYNYVVYLYTLDTKIIELTLSASNTVRVACGSTISHRRDFNPN